MSAVCIAKFELDKDLSPLIAQLHALEIIHRIVEEQGAQFLWLQTQQQMAAAGDLINRFEQGQLAPPLDSAQHAQAAFSTTALLSFIVQAPMTWLFIVLGIIGYAAVALPLNTLLSYLTYTPIIINGDYFSQAPFDITQIWRLLTPMFIHFSFVHILFNAGAMVQVGSWLERYWGAYFYVFLCLFTGAVGNIVQYVWFESVMFGGLSGVVFGVFTFNGVTQWLNPRKAVRLPLGAYAWLLVWLVAGFTPLMTWAFGVQMGNGAHLGGTLAGLFLALMANFRGIYAHR